MYLPFTVFAGFCNEIQSFASPGGLERYMAGKQMDRPGDAPVAVLWDVAFIPPAFQIVLGFGRHQSKYVSSFCAWFVRLSLPHTSYKVFLLLRAKRARIPAVTRQILIIKLFLVNLIGLGFNSHFPIKISN